MWAGGMAQQVKCLCEREDQSATPVSALGMEQLWGEDRRTPRLAGSIF